MIKKYFRNWRNLRKSRKFGEIMKFSLIIAGLIISLFTTLTYMSINSFFYNVSVPSDSPEYYMNFSDTKNAEKWHLKISYKISNKGYVDITNIYLIVGVDVIYTEKAKDRETSRTVFLKKELIGYCHPGENLVDTFIGNYSDFDDGEIGKYLNEVDKSKEIIGLMSIEVSASLSGAVQFYIRLDNIDLEGEYN